MVSLNKSERYEKYCNSDPEVKVSFLLYLLWCHKSESVSTANVLTIVMVQPVPLPVYVLWLKTTQTIVKPRP